VRILLRVTGGLLLIFIGVLTLIRAQPAPPEPLATMFVPPEGCDMPCFLGIRIGETNAEEAIAILQTHLWIDQVLMDPQQGYIRWNWSADAPRYLNSFRENQIVLRRETWQVATITLRLDVPTGLLWRSLSATTTVEGDPVLAYVRVDGANCMVDPMNFWGSPVQRVYYTARGVEQTSIYRTRRAYEGPFACD
jgi:hypothetical protein